jgi:hypothetical protein
MQEKEQRRSKRGQVWQEGQEGASEAKLSDDTSCSAQCRRKSRDGQNVGRCGRKEPVKQWCRRHQLQHATQEEEQRGSERGQGRQAGASEGKLSDDTSCSEPCDKESSEGMSVGNGGRQESVKQSNCCVTYTCVIC